MADAVPIQHAPTLDLKLTHANATRTTFHQPTRKQIVRQSTTVLLPTEDAVLIRHVLTLGLKQIHATATRTISRPRTAILTARLSTTV